ASGLGITELVKVVSGIPIDELPPLYCGAEMLAMPSLWEGFGLPLVEAMACGVPIVCSNVSSLPEVVGDAAVLVKPGDALDLAAGIATLFSSSSLQKDLRKRGISRAVTYRWENTVEATLAAYRSVI
ncbi:MAG: glycosyltransferase, partial [Bacteroidota bacterium]